VRLLGEVFADVEISYILQETLKDKDLYHFQFETALCAFEATEDGTNRTKGTNGTGLKLRVTAK
jgi:hypothetical protein